MVETYTKMAPAEFMKYDWRIDVFLDKFKNKKPFHLASGKEIIFDYNPTVEKIMKSRNQRAMRDIILLGSDGVYHKLSALGKDKDFGGKGAGFAVRSEEMELTRFNDQLDDIKSRINRGVVPVKIGNTIYEVAAGECNIRGSHHNRHSPEGSPARHQRPRRGYGPRASGRSGLRRHIRR